MNYNKKDFNKEHKRLRLLEIDGKLDMYSAGRLSLIDNVENLILCGVGCFLELKEKQILIKLIKTEGQTTLMNYADKDWIKEYINDRNKLIEKIEELP